MIEGRTMLTGTSPRVSASARSPRAFVYAYASGQPSAAAPARPRSTSRPPTHCPRRPSARAGRGRPAGGAVPAEGRDPPGDLGVEAVAPLPPEAVEGVVAEDVAPDPLGRPGPAPGPHEGQQLALGHGAEEPLTQRRPQEAG